MKIIQTLFIISLQLLKQSVIFMIIIYKHVLTHYLKQFIHKMKTEKIFIK